MSKFGFHDDNQFSDADLTESVRHFQITFGLDPSGRVDKDTRALMDTPRCGRPDNEFYGDLNYNAYYQPKWHKKELTYYFDSYTNDINRDDLIRETAKAFKYWSDVSSLSFRRVERNGDIVIA